MAESCEEILDPRIRRTRDLLQQALAKLLETKEFEKISVQDIAEAATVNRATFYDHYPDKFALLECMVGGRFRDLLAARGVHFDGTCSGALRAIALGLCDFLADSPGTICEKQRQTETHLESAVIAVIRGMILAGVRTHSTGARVSPEMIATTASWALYGAAKEWARTPNRCASQDIVETVVSLVSPIFVQGVENVEPN